MLKCACFGGWHKGLSAVCVCTIDTFVQSNRQNSNMVQTVLQHSDQHLAFLDNWFIRNIASGAESPADRTVYMTVCVPVLASNSRRLS